MIYFTNYTEAAPQAKVKKRKTLKQALQEKEEKTKEQALKRLEEAQSMKEVKKLLCCIRNTSNISFHVQAGNKQAPGFSKTGDYLKPSEEFWWHFISYPRKVLNPNYCLVQLEQ